MSLIGSRNSRDLEVRPLRQFRTYVFLFGSSRIRDLQFPHFCLSSPHMALFWTRDTVDLGFWQLKILDFWQFLDFFWQKKIFSSMNVEQRHRGAEKQNKAETK